MSLRTLILERKLPPQEIRRLEKIQPWISTNGDRRHYTLISDRWELPGMFIDEPCSAYDKITGRMIFHLPQGVLQHREYELPWNNLRCGGTPVSCSSRARTVGRDDLEHQDQDATERVIGFMDRQGGRFQYARRTGWTRDHEKEYLAVQPFIRRLDELAHDYAPKERAQQWAVAQQRPEYLMSPVFSTGTINLGIRCRPHRDSGNLHLSAMTVTDLSDAPVQGGELLLLEYLTAISIRNEDVLIFDGHALHATAQFFTTSSPSLIRGVQRLSCIFYYRAGLAKCLAPEEELRRAQQRMAATW
jgi:hypothetical protein